MGDFPTLFACSIGLETGFQLTDWSYKSEPQFVDGQFTHRKVTIEAEGEISGVTPGDFAAQVASLQENFEINGESLIITGLGGVAELALPAARCLNGGPFIALSIGKQAEATRLVKRISFTATAEVLDGPGYVDVRKYRSRRRSVQLWDHEVSGKLVGPDASAAFEDQVLPGLLTAFPSNAYKIEYEKTRSPADLTVEWRFTASELSELLPSANADDYACDGLKTIGEDIDEQGRKLKRWVYELSYAGDFMQLLRLMRPGLAEAPVITRESFEVTSISDRKLRAMFEAVVTPDGLLSFECMVSFDTEDVTVEALEYKGVGTELASKLTQVSRITMAGRAVGAQRFPKAPTPPQFAGYFYEELPKINCRELNRLECETTWSYAWVGKVGFDVKKLLPAARRPATPEFYDA